MSSEFQAIFDSLHKIYADEGSAETVWQKGNQAGYLDALTGAPDSEQWRLAADLWRHAATQRLRVPLAETILVRWICEQSGLLRPQGACTIMWNEELETRQLTELTFVRHVLIIRDSVCELLNTDDAEHPKLVVFNPSRALALAALMRCYEMTGAAEKAVAIAIAHASERVQFGRSIGKFQAVQHLIARAAAESLAARLAADSALQKIESTEFEIAVAVAKSRCGEACSSVCSVTHQVLGALGFSLEHELNRFTSALLRWRDEYGAESYWNQRLADAFLRQSNPLWTAIVGYADA
jgi:hypothetical protein